MFTSNNDDEAETRCLGQKMWTVRPVHFAERIGGMLVYFLAKVSYTRVDWPSALCYRGVFRCSVCHLGICSGFASTVQKPSSGGPMYQTGANMRPSLFPGYPTGNSSQLNENSSQLHNVSQKSGQKWA